MGLGGHNRRNRLLGTPLCGDDPTTQIAIRDNASQLPALSDKGRRHTPLGHRLGRRFNRRVGTELQGVRTHRGSDRLHEKRRLSPVAGSPAQAALSAGVKETVNMAMLAAQRLQGIFRQAIDQAILDGQVIARVRVGVFGDIGREAFTAFQTLQQTTLLLLVHHATAQDKQTVAIRRPKAVLAPKISNFQLWCQCGQHLIIQAVERQALGNKILH